MKPTATDGSRQAPSRSRTAIAATLALGLAGATAAVLAWLGYPRVGTEWLLGAALRLCG
ncbi:MAG: hypothetical protein JSW68_06255 [Burkholderiales bacterium]|nr:MAG: hypothetical protein JSW68_06255 [Burkholderiales bacterium]